MILVVVFIKVWPKDVKGFAFGLWPADIVFSDTVHLSDVHHSSKILVDKDRFG